MLSCHIGNLELFSHIFLTFFLLDPGKQVSMEKDHSLTLTDTFRIHIQPFFLF